MNDPIIILGFGRSGTTWISDIVSKCLGGLMLFEPLHPEVYTNAKNSCYHNASDESLVQEMDSFLEDCMKGRIDNKWLLRNHISASLEEVSPNYVDTIWNECNVLGFKAIRGNFMIPHFYENYSHKIVFIKRHPCAVASSLMNRKRFWEEFGLDFHTKKFFEETIDSEKYEYLNASRLHEIYDDLDEDYLRMIFLWTVTHIIVENDLQRLNLPIFHYEDFYTRPFESVRNLCEYLGKPNINVHPSYLFTPSMLTLKTHHEFSGNDDFASPGNSRVFWEKTIDIEKENKIMALIEKIKG